MRIANLDLETIQTQVFQEGPVCLEHLQQIQLHQVGQKIEEESLPRRILTGGEQNR